MKITNQEETGRVRYVAINAVTDKGEEFEALMIITDGENMAIPDYSLDDVSITLTAEEKTALLDMAIARLTE